MGIRSNLSAIIVLSFLPFLGASTCTTEGNSHNLKFVQHDCGNFCISEDCGGPCPFGRPIALHGTIGVQIAHLDGTSAGDVELMSTNSVSVKKIGIGDFQLEGVGTGSAKLVAHSLNGGDDDTLDVTVQSPDNLRFVDATLNPRATVSFPMGTMNTEHWDIPAAVGGSVSFQLAPFFGDEQLTGKLQYHRTGAALTGESSMPNSTDGILIASLPSAPSNQYSVKYDLSDPVMITFNATIAVH